MALRVLVLMMVLMSPMTGLSLAWSQSLGSMQAAEADRESMWACPLCAFAEMPMGCGCGCGVSEMPMPAGVDLELAVVAGSDRWEPIEHEITDFVSLIVFDDSYAWGDSILEAEGGIGSGSGVHSFLSQTGHWIL